MGGIGSGSSTELVATCLRTTLAQPHRSQGQHHKQACELQDCRLFKPARPREAQVPRPGQGLAAGTEAKTTLPSSLSPSVCCHLLAAAWLRNSRPPGDTLTYSALNSMNPSGFQLPQDSLPSI